MNWWQAILVGVLYLIGAVYLTVLFFGATAAIEILDRQTRRRERRPFRLTVEPTPGNEGKGEETKP